MPSVVIARYSCYIFFFKSMNWRSLFLVVVLFANCTPVFASTCTAKVKSGKSPYSHIKANKNISFWSYSVGTLGEYPQYGVTKSFVGDRMLMIPVRDLYDISSGCAELKEYRENY